MGVVVKLPIALQQLIEITDHIAADNLTAALNWLDEMDAAFDTLSNQPF
jgi:plasmid stabilization system protein ParE